MITDHTLSATSNAVAMEGNEIPKGWPLGLGNINSRITVVDSSQVVAPPQPAVLRRCSSFSSFSSSNLDTESTASFFPDQSVPLGRLIGIRAAGPGDKVESENSNEECGDIDEARALPLDSQGRICTPLLHHVISRIFRTSKHHLHTLPSQ